MIDSQFVVDSSPRLQSHLKMLVVGLLVVGVFFRFSHLDQKVYWHDEAFTSLAVSGHTLAELKQAISDSDPVMPIASFEKYQTITPGRNIADTVHYLSTSDPQHPPLYYVLARLWAQAFNDSPASLRSLSALISLLVLPCLYWLCLELFESSAIAWISLGIAAVSPFELFFAQEARQYGLWMVFILMSSAILLASIRKENDLGLWGAYAIALTLGLYTHLFMAPVAAAQGAYVLICQRFHWSKVVRSYCLSTAIAVLLFSPWIWVFINHLQTALDLTAWSQVTLISNPAILIAILLTRISRIFLDFNTATDAVWIDSLSAESSDSYGAIAMIACAVFVSYLTYFLWRKERDSSHYLFVVLLGTIPTLFLLTSDITLGGIRSIYFRYQLPLCLSVQLSVAYMLGSNLTYIWEWKHKIWQFLFIAVVLVSLFSDVKMLSASSWWLQINGRSTISISALLNKTECPLLLTNSETSNVGAILTLSRRLNPDISVAFVEDDSFVDTLMEIEGEYKNTFFFDFSSALESELMARHIYTATLIEPTVGFKNINKREASQAVYKE